MELNLNAFENLNLYSNKSMEQLLTSIVNKSSNACLVNVFEDAVVLLDHEDGQFYFADYQFDKDNLTVKFENFEPVELEEDVSNFENKVYEFFDRDDLGINELSESYKEEVLEKQNMLKDLINSAMSKKNFENIVDYKEVVEAKKDLVIESSSLPVYQKYVERLTTHPLTEAKYFNWTDPVVVSLSETEPYKIINTGAIESANNLWKDSEFKQNFVEACETFVEDVETGEEMLSTLFEEYPQVYYLDKADRKTLFGKTIISDSSLREDTSDILKGLDLLFEKFSLKEIRENFLNENQIDEQDGDTDVPAGGQAQEEEPAKEKAPEVKKPDADTMIKDLKAIAKSEKLSDKSKEKIDAVISGLEGMGSEGTKPEVVKEAVSILRM
jgi:hypothetical protein